ncbi:aspartate aminotransferase family protein [Nitratireductor sp. ZSWI3]|uniref:aminotransferase family protein n=1 Tax=Nitratireductor sp. ZSWI3 TaxID=2966359 RepID=UPI00214FE20C|nr:aminotransferase class III-fold pyridoxal phosphate-dependent enzyme [Nitratireductor sp. ZSWI3]MCR4265809.1 aminotransferase class III-fold pyridoxal phosphate-dependent enzyme [Nitratireductor sp. ZSWI3]
MTMHDSNQASSGVVGEGGGLDRAALDHTVFSLVPRAELEAEGPRILTAGSGARVSDHKGRTILDMLSATTRANSLGYGNAEIGAAMARQAEVMQYSGSGRFLSEPAVRLSEKLAQLAPGRLNRTVFVSGGSEATETALKLARQYQRESGRKPRAYKVISRWNAYHGSTLGALSVTDWLGIRDIPDPRAPGHSFVANPMRLRNPYGLGEDEYEDICVAHLERQILHEGPDLVAAFIGEPIMQANGAQVPSRSYWQRVREVCSRYGVLLVADEVISGFGRTGHWFACEYFGIEPDIMTMAKAMSAGFAPIGAVMTRDEIADALPIFRHVHTFAGHAVACAAASKVIEIKERDGLVERARRLGDDFAAMLREAVGDLLIVGQVRGLGFWQAVDFCRDRETGAPFADDTVPAIAAAMLDQGVLAGAIGTAIEFAPPLVTTQEQLAECARALVNAIEKVSREKELKL